MMPGESDSLQLPPTACPALPCRLPVCSQVMIWFRGLVTRNISERGAKGVCQYYHSAPLVISQPVICAHAAKYLMTNTDTHPPTHPHAHAHTCASDWTGLGWLAVCLTTYGTCTTDEHSQRS